MQIFKRIFLDFIILLLVLACGILGVFAPLDDALKSFRFSLSPRLATTDIVLVEIDPEGIRSIGAWPWPRRVQSKIIDKLVALDASNIILDVDLSFASTKFDDTLFERALSQANGRVSLAAFRQQFDVESDAVVLALPLAQFAAHANIVAFDVTPDRSGIVTSYPRGVEADGKLYPSFASALVGEEATRGSFRIDYGIDVAGVARIPISLILNGDVDPSMIAGKQVVVSASAPELRGDLAVPRHGALSRPLLHIVAAETLKQDRALSGNGMLFGVMLALMAAVMFGFLRNRFNLAVAVGGGVAACVGAEVAALLLQNGPGILIDSMVCHVAIASFAIASFSRDLDFRALLLNETTRDRNTTRSILNRVISDNFDGVIVVSSDGSILTASRFAEKMLDFTIADIAQDLDVEDVLPSVLAAEVKVALRMHDEIEQSTETSEATVVDKSGRERTIEYVITLSHVEDDVAVPAAGNNGAIACLTFRDVTERRATETRLTYLAAHDPLTGALSRAKLAELVNSAMSSEDGRFIGMTIIMLDLSRFKVINDTLGHSYGDALLKQVVGRFKSCDVDCVARMGGDSFAAARAGILNSDELSAFCDSVLKKISDIYQLGEHRAMIGAQIGVTDTDVSGYEPDVLISHADMALSAAKNTPVNGYAVYTPEMDEHLNEMQDMEVALRNAIVHDEFALLYQPQVLLDDSEMIGVEALVRWSHPTLGTVSPAKFIPVAEETGLILDLGRWVLETACTEVASWPGEMKLAVNVSPMQFEFGDVVADVKHALEVSGLPASRLDVEITEGVFISQLQLVTQKLGELKALGVGVALDDFGTGFSSLSYLSQLPIDKIKIDQAFVRGLPQDQHSAAVVRAIMTLSESLGKVVIAEGIENADQAWMLRLAGCQVGQGYHFGKPLESCEIVERLESASDTSVVAK